MTPREIVGLVLAAVAGGMLASISLSHLVGICALMMSYHFYFHPVAEESKPSKEKK